MKLEKLNDIKDLDKWYPSSNLWWFKATTSIVGSSPLFLGMCYHGHAEGIYIDPVGIKLKILIDINKYEHEIYVSQFISMLQLKL